MDDSVEDEIFGVGLIGRGGGGGGRMLMGCYRDEGCYGDNGRLVIEQRSVLIVCLTALLPLSV